MVTALGTSEETARCEALQAEVCARPRTTLGTILTSAWIALVGLVLAGGIIVLFSNLP